MSGNTDAIKEGMPRWQKVVIWIAAVVIVIYILGIVVAGLDQLLIDPIDPDDGKHEIKTITPSGVVA
jgi:hypothetical protein